MKLHAQNRRFSKTALMLALAAPFVAAIAPAHAKTIKGSQTIWDFVYFHECAHAQQPSLSEIEANCASYKEMESRGLMNYNRMKELEAVHLGMMGNLPEEYGGSGAMFWHKTMQCVRKGSR